MARPPSAESVLRKMKGRRPEPKTPIADDMFLPNHSGVTVHPEFKNFLTDNYLKIDGTNSMNADITLENGGTVGNADNGEVVISESGATQTVGLVVDGSAQAGGPVLKGATTLDASSRIFFNASLRVFDNSLLGFGTGISCPI